MVRQGDPKTLANVLHHFLHTRLGIITETQELPSPHLTEVMLDKKYPSRPTGPTEETVTVTVAA